MQIQPPPRRPARGGGLPLAPARRPPGQGWAFEARPVGAGPRLTPRPRPASGWARAAAALTAVEGLGLLAVAAFALAQVARAGLTALSAAALATCAGIVVAATLLAWGARQLVARSAAWRIALLFAQAFLFCFMGGLAVSAATTPDAGGPALTAILLSATVLGAADLLCVAMARPPRPAAEPAPPRHGAR